SSTVRAATAVAVTKAAAGAVSAPAAALMEGALRAMLIAKMKAVAAVVASVAVLGVGGGVAGYRAVAQAQTETGGYTTAAGPAGAAPAPRQMGGREAAKLKGELEAARAKREMARAQVELLARKLAEVEKAARAAEKPAPGGATATTTGSAAAPTK